MSWKVNEGNFMCRREGEVIIYLYRSSEGEGEGGCRKTKKGRKGLSVRERER